jgi:hypothetical protein
MSDDVKVRFTPTERVLATDELRMVITCVMGGEDMQPDGIALKVAGFRIATGADFVPLLWAHGFDARGRFPLGSVRNIRPEVVDGKSVLVGEKHYYQPSEALASLKTDLAMMPAIVFDMKRQGHFKAVSMGFRIIDGVQRDDGIEATAWHLHELSDCPVGLDPVALDRFVRDTKLNDSQRDWLIGRECRGCGQCKSDPQQPAIKQASGMDVVISALQALDPRRVNG